MKRVLVALILLGSAIFASAQDLLPEVRDYSSQISAEILSIPGIENRDVYVVAVDFYQEPVLFGEILQSFIVSELLRSDNSPAQTFKSTMEEAFNQSEGLLIYGALYPIGNQLIVHVDSKDLTTGALLTSQLLTLDYDGDIIPLIDTISVGPTEYIAADSYEPDNSIDQASQLLEQILQDHTLSSGDSDAFSIEVTEPCLISVETRGDLDTTLALYSLSGEMIDSNDDDGSDYNAKITRSIDEPGTYSLIVTGYDSSEVGAYSIYFETEELIVDIYEPDNNSSQATSLESGQDEQDHQLSEYDSDWFSFEVDDVNSGEVWTSGDSDTLITLYDASLNELLYSDDDGVDYNGAISFSDLESGIYYVEVTLYSSDSGQSPYSIGFNLQ